MDGCNYPFNGYNFNAGWRVPYLRQGSLSWRGEGQAGSFVHEQRLSPASAERKVEDCLSFTLKFHGKGEHR
jgi:hypothetical protein